MATPVIESKTTVSWQSASTTISVTKPSGTVSGDLLVAYVVSNGGTVPSDETGWTTINSQDQISMSMKAYYKVAGGSEPSSYTFDNAGSQEMAAIMYRISGFSTAAPIAGYIGDTEPNSDQTPTFTGSLAPGRPDALLIMGVLGNDNTSADTYIISGTNPTWTEQIDVAASTPDSTFASASAPANSASAITSFGLSWGVSGTDDAVAILVSIPEQADVNDTLSSVALQSLVSDTTDIVNVNDIGTSISLRAQVSELTDKAVNNPWVNEAVESTTWTNEEI